MFKFHHITFFHLASNSMAEAHTLLMHVCLNFSMSVCLFLRHLKVSMTVAAFWVLN